MPDRSQYFIDNDKLQALLAVGPGRKLNHFNPTAQNVNTPRICLHTITVATKNNRPFAAYQRIVPVSSEGSRCEGVLMKSIIQAERTRRAATYIRDEIC